MGPVAEADAVFVTDPESTSVCVTEYEPVQVIRAPGAKDATGVAGTQDNDPSLVSLTLTSLKVTLPVLVATRV